MVLLTVLETTVHTLQHASVFHVSFLWVQSGVGLTLKEGWIPISHSYARFYVQSAFNLLDSKCWLL